MNLIYKRLRFVNILLDDIIWFGDKLIKTPDFCILFQRLKYKLYTDNVYRCVIISSVLHLVLKALVTCAAASLRPQLPDWFVHLSRIDLT